MDSNKEKVLTKQDIETIIDKLSKKLGQDLGNIEKQVFEITNDKLPEPKYNEIKDFLKQFWADLLFEADKKLKLVEADFSKLEKRLKEVNGENEEFIDFLSKANTDPHNKAWVDLINSLLGESRTDEASMHKIKDAKDQIWSLLDNMRKKLKSQNPQNVKVSEIEDLIWDTADAAKLV